MLYLDVVRQRFPRAGLCLSVLLAGLVLHGGSATARSQADTDIVTVAPPLELDGTVYTVRYSTTGSQRETSAAALFNSSLDDFARRRISRIYVSRDGDPVSDPDELTRVFQAYRAAAYLYRRGSDYDLGSMPPGFRDDLDRVISNPVFPHYRVGAAVEGRREQTLEALRAALTPSVADPAVEELVETVHDHVEDYEKVTDTIDAAIEAMRWQDSASLRQLQADARRFFDDWQHATDPVGQHLLIAGTRIEIVNGLDFVALGLRLLAASQLSTDRGKWLSDYSALGRSAPGWAGEGALDADQLAAAEKIIDEAMVADTLELDIFSEFIAEEGGALGGRAGGKLIGARLAAWSANRVGSDLAVHRLVGAASASGIGVTLGEVLLGTDDMYSHMTVAKRSDELRERFRDRRLALQAEARADDRLEVYNGDLALQYRSAYMLEALSAAQAHRSYADGVTAVGRHKVFELLRHLAWWAKDEDWLGYAHGLHAMANTEEAVAEAALGHPDYVGAAVMLATLAPDASPLPPGGGPVADARAAARRLARAMRSMGRDAERAAADVAARLTELSERVRTIVRGGPPPMPVEVAHVYMESVRRLDGGEAVSQFRPEDRLAMQLIHRAAFVVAREVGIEVAFEDELHYEVESETPDTAQVQVTGTMSLWMPSVTDEPVAREAVDLSLPLVRDHGQWYLRGSDELNAFLAELQSSFVR